MTKRDIFVALHQMTDFKGPVLYVIGDIYSHLKPKGAAVHNQVSGKKKKNKTKQKTSTKKHNLF